MILVDTSVWIEHFRQGTPALKELLIDGTVFGHPFVSGELACGHLHRRQEILSLIGALPQAKIADHEEVLQFVINHRLMGLGLGWIDMHLLASAALTQAFLWTKDKKLSRASERLHLGYGLN